MLHTGSNRPWTFQNTIMSSHAGPFKIFCWLLLPIVIQLHLWLTPSINVNWQLVVFLIGSNQSEREFGRSNSFITTNMCNDIAYILIKIFNNSSCFQEPHLFQETSCKTGIHIHNVHFKLNMDPSSFEINAYMPSDHHQLLQMKSYRYLITSKLTVLQYNK